MSKNIQTLRPGLLISLKSSLTGNVKYIPNDRKVTIDADGKEITEIETTRVIADPVEYKRAGEARSKARSIISSVCVGSNFGLLCPEQDKDVLDAAIKDARAVVDAFNASAAMTHISVYAMIGRIASDDVEAVRSINSEVSDLLGQMEAGLKNLDVKSIRDAANKAKQVGQMLTADAAERVKKAVDAVRSSARQIVKAGETAAAEIDLNAIRTVTNARLAFLDLDEAKEVAAPRQEARALDLTPETTAPAKAKPKARALEL
jgi:predicted phage tail protein